MRERETKNSLNVH